MAFPIISASIISRDYYLDQSGGQYRSYNNSSINSESNSRYRNIINGILVGSSLAVTDNILSRQKALHQCWFNVLCLIGIYQVICDKSNCAEKTMLLTLIHPKILLSNGSVSWAHMFIPHIGDDSDNPLVYTVDLVIFVCFNFRKFLILRLFTKFRIREFSFLFSGAIIIIIFARL